MIALQYLRCIVEQMLDNNVVKVIPYDEEHPFSFSYAEFGCVDLLEVLRLHLQ